MFSVWIIRLIYIYFIGQQGKPYIKAFDLRLEAVQHNTYYITIYNIGLSAQIQLQENYNIESWSQFMLNLYHTMY